MSFPVSNNVYPVPDDSFFHELLNPVRLSISTPTPPSTNLSSEHGYPSSEQAPVSSSRQSSFSPLRQPSFVSFEEHAFQPPDLGYDYHHGHVAPPSSQQPWPVDPRFPGLGNGASMAPATPYVENSAAAPELITDYGIPVQMMMPQGLPVNAPAFAVSAHQSPFPGPGVQQPLAPPVLLAPGKVRRAMRTQRARKDLVEDGTDKTKRKNENVLAARKTRDNREAVVAHWEGLLALWEWRLNPLPHLRPPPPPPWPADYKMDGRAMRTERARKELVDDGTEETTRKNSNARAARKSREGKDGKMKVLKARVESSRARAYEMGWKKGMDEYDKYE